MTPLGVSHLSERRERGTNFGSSSRGTTHEHASSEANLLVTFFPAGFIATSVLYIGSPAHHLPQYAADKGSPAGHGPRKVEEQDDPLFRCIIVNLMGVRVIEHERLPFFPRAADAADFHHTMFSLRGNDE